MLLLVAAALALGFILGALYGRSTNPLLDRVEPAAEATEPIGVDPNEGMPWPA